MKKRIFAAFLAAVMVLAFAACNVKEIEEPQTTTRTRTRTEKESTTLPETTEEEETATATEDAIDSDLRLPLRPPADADDNSSLKSPVIEFPEGVEIPITKKETTTKKVTTTKKPTTTTQKETTMRFSLGISVVVSF